MKYSAVSVGFMVLFTLLISGCLTGRGGNVEPDPDHSTLYVSQEGNDSWSGRYPTPKAGGNDGPFATVERARDEIRSLKDSGSLPAGEFTVWIREGVYYQASEFRLGSSDSGTVAGPIVYRAYPGEKVVLTGGRTIEPSWFTPVTDNAVLQRIICSNARQEVLQVDLSYHGINDYGQLARRGFRFSGDIPPMELFVDGERMTLARWPNEGVVQMGEIIDPGAKFGDPDFHTRGGTYSYTYNRPHLWSAANDIWVQGIFGYSWEWSYNKVGNIDTQNQQITLAHGEVSGLVKQWFPDHHVFENLLEEIDMPGEYYIDREAGILYFYPPTSFGEDSLVLASMSKTPIVSTDNASHVVFQDLVFDTGRHVAINITGGHEVRISHCEITNFTNGGIRVNGNEHQVTHSHIYNVGGRGVQVSGGSWQTLTGGGNLVYNNKIHDTSYFHRVYNPAVTISGVGQKIVNNEIFNTPHMGLVVHGNDHRIEYNEFYKTCEDYSDMGAIYMHLGGNQEQRGTVIYRNYFHRIGLTTSGVKGVYLDDGTSGVTVDQNIFYRVNSPSTAAGAILHDTGHNNTARHNLFINCPLPYTHQYHLSTSAFALNKFTRWQNDWEQLFANYNLENMPHSKYPGLLAFLEPSSYYNYEEHGITYPNSSVFSGNITFNPTVSLRHSGQMIHFPAAHLRPGVDTNQLLTMENNHIATTNPGFENWQSEDFRLRSDAPLFDWIPDFPKIPFERMGLVEPFGPFGAN